MDTFHFIFDLTHSDFLAQFRSLTLYFYRLRSRFASCLGLIGFLACLYSLIITSFDPTIMLITFIFLFLFTLFILWPLISWRKIEKELAANPPSAIRRMDFGKNSIIGTIQGETAPYLVLPYRLISSIRITRFGFMLYLQRGTESIHNIDPNAPIYPYAHQAILFPLCTLYPQEPAAFIEYLKTILPASIPIKGQV